MRGDEPPTTATASPAPSKNKPLHHPPPGRQAPVPRPHTHTPPLKLPGLQLLLNAHIRKHSLSHTHTATTLWPFQHKNNNPPSRLPPEEPKKPGPFSFFPRLFSLFSSAWLEEVEEIEEEEAPWWESMPGMCECVSVCIIFMY